MATTHSLTEKRATELRAEIRRLVTPALIRAAMDERTPTDGDYAVLASLRTLRADYPETALLHASEVVWAILHVIRPHDGPAVPALARLYAALAELTADADYVPDAADLGDPANAPRVPAHLRPARS